MKRLMILLAGVAAMLLVAADATADKKDPPKIDARARRKIETATFGMGCFWCPDYTFGSVPGVVRTRVGYAGGTTKDPDYENIGDHTETIQIDYDPAVTSYEKLLEKFWAGHSANIPAYSRQYRSLILVHNDAQRQAAEASLAEQEKSAGTKMSTEIIPLKKFYLGEGYHQKYTLQQYPELYREFLAMYPHDDAWIDSTAAARVNAFLMHKGDKKQLRAEIGDYGLSEKAQQTLLRLAGALEEETP